MPKTEIIVQIWLQLLMHFFDVRNVYTNLGL